MLPNMINTHMINSLASATLRPKTSADARGLNGHQAVIQHDLTLKSEDRKEGWWAGVMGRGCSRVHQQQLAYQQSIGLSRVGVGVQQIGRPQVIQQGRWNSMSSRQEGNRNDTATFAHAAQPLQQFLPLPGCRQRRLLHRRRP